MLAAREQGRTLKTFQHWPGPAPTSTYKYKYRHRVYKYENKYRYRLHYRTILGAAIISIKYHHFMVTQFLDYLGTQGYMYQQVSNKFCIKP